MSLMLFSREINCLLILMGKQVLIPLFHILISTLKTYYHHKSPPSRPIYDSQINYGRVVFNVLKKKRKEKKINRDINVKFFCKSNKMYVYLSFQFRLGLSLPNPENYALSE